MAIEFKDETITDQSADSDILAGYTEPLTETAPVVESAPVDSEPTADIPASDSQKPASNETDWRGNKAYYQTGAKAGQLRPTGKIRATIDKTQVTQIHGGYLITGAMFLTLIDMLIPMLIVGLNNWISEDKVTLDQIRLKKDREKGIDVKKELEPLGEATLKQLNIEGNPLLLLSLTLGCNYAFNFISFKALNKKPDKDTSKK